MNELLEQIRALTTRLEQAEAWIEQRKRQAFPFPLDDHSKVSSGFLSAAGLDTTSTTTQSINTAGATANVPAAYAGYLLVDVDGTQRKIPYVS
jgi:hypothetical protein